MQEIHCAYRESRVYVNAFIRKVRFGHVGGGFMAKIKKRITEKKRKIKGTFTSFYVRWKIIIFLVTFGFFSAFSSNPSDSQIHTVNECHFRSHSTQCHIVPSKIKQTNDFLFSSWSLPLPRLTRSLFSHFSLFF